MTYPTFPGDFSHLICTTPGFLKNKMKREVPTASLKGEKKVAPMLFENSFK